MYRKESIFWCGPHDTNIVLIKLLFLVIFQIVCIFSSCMPKSNHLLTVPETRRAIQSQTNFTTDRCYLCPSVRLAGQVMRLQGWTSFIRTTTAAGFLSAVSRQQAALGRSHIHVRPLSRSVANMAEEAKKLAAYAAVDNHVQVGFGPPGTLAASFTQSPLNKSIYVNTCVILAMC